MYFCPNCDNIFDITKLSKQIGGSGDTVATTSSLHSSDFAGGANIYADVIDNILKKIEIEPDIIDKINLEDLVKSNEYRKLSVKQKELIFNSINELLPINKKRILKEDEKKSDEMAYFVCNNCGYLKPIPEKTLIFSRVSNDISQSYSSSDIQEMAFSDILTRTRKYVCPNNSCPSHSTPNLREAIFFRKNNTFKIIYICTACYTSF